MEHLEPYAEPSAEPTSQDLYNEIGLGFADVQTINSAEHALRVEEYTLTRVADNSM